MKWKTYFWIYSVMTLGGIFISIPSLHTYNFITLHGLVEGLLIVVITFSYVFNKRILPSGVWKCLFVYLLLLWTLQIIVTFLPSDQVGFLKTNIGNGLDGVSTIIFAIVLAVPGMVALYRLGKGKFLSDK